ncbi:MAG: hypothetical protein VKM34_05880 [Cyanobacteriota bacterium]|nr:hypothetical protein [Cyanobacteriota bacterium]
MAAHQANGARLGWLLLPHQHAWRFGPSAVHRNASTPLTGSMLDRGV